MPILYLMGIGPNTKKIPQNSGKQIRIPEGMYSDSQKHESSCLLSDRFWCISPEPFELQKIFLPLLAYLFEEFSDRKEFF